MEFIIFAIIIFVACFCFVIFVGAPYLPTLSAQQKTALELLDLKPGQKILDLGSGDGRVLKIAAKKGLYAVGIEINPLLVCWSYLTTIKYRKNVKIIWGNYWKKDWPKVDGIFVFLLDSYMEKLDKKIKTNNSKIKLVSFAFKIPDKKTISEKNGVYLYEY